MMRKFAFPLISVNELKKMEDKKMKTVILMIFLTQYCVSGTKKCPAKALFEATKRRISLLIDTKIFDISVRTVLKNFRIFFES